MVVAAWRENMDFVNPMLSRVPHAEAMIYCAGGELQDPRCNNIPNYGHENYAYLRHIVDHYEEGLAHITVFTMGSVMKKELNFILCRKLNYVLASVDSEAKQADFSGYETLASVNPGFFVPFDENFTISQFKRWTHGAPRPLCPASVSTLGEWYQKFVDGDLEKARMAGIQYNSIFAVSRERLRSRPKSVYEGMLREVERCELGQPQVAGHFLERTWKPMLDHHRPGKNIPDSGPNECPIAQLIEASNGTQGWPGWASAPAKTPGLMLIQGGLQLLAGPFGVEM